MHAPWGHQSGCESAPRSRVIATEESPTIVRTAEGMAVILELGQSLDAVLSAPGPSSQAETFNTLLRSYIGKSESDADCNADSDSEGMALDGVVPHVTSASCSYSLQDMSCINQR
jgi:hypothetical protein